MITQILLWLNDAPSTSNAIIWALSLAQTLSARVYALYILPPEPTHRTGTELSKKRNRKSNPEKEEKAWELLYEVEDEAFDRNIRISLLLEQGEPLACFSEICSIYNPDLIVVSADGPLPSVAIINQSPKPVVFVKTTAPAENIKEE
ncbi:MAG: universal stress protein [bacterium]